MTPLRLLVRNLFYHWRANLAIFLGIALGTAVLTGALLVGDSLRGSLRSLALDQLGWVDEAMVTGRFFRAKLAEEMPAERSVPAIMLQASAEGPRQRAAKVNLLGVDAHFWPESMKIPARKGQMVGQGVVLNRSLALALDATVGDEIVFQVQKADSIPRESLLGKRKTDDVVQSLTFEVRAILPDEGMARFTLKPSPEPVRNAFVPLQVLQQALDLPDQANAILVGKVNSNLSAALQKQLTMDDWNLRLRTPADRARGLVKYLDPKNKDGKLSKKKWEGRVPEVLAKQADAAGVLTVAQVNKYFEEHRPYLSLESGRMFLEPLFEKAVGQLDHFALNLTGYSVSRSTPLGRGRAVEPVLVYLADALKHDGQETPYAVVAGVSGLEDDEIRLVNWPDSPIKAQPGSAITLDYFVPDANNQLQKRHARFLLSHTLDLEGVLDDPDLTPEFPGITDKFDMRNWENPPFPYDPKRIKAVDENYWKRYRTTPKAYVSLAKARQLWAGRFGNLTSIRLLGPKEEELRSALLAKLNPTDGGFVFQPVKDLAERAGGGATDFGMLFLAFSFFLIAAALLLVGLLIRLSLDRRAAEVGLLLATGWSHRRVRWLLLAEGTLLAIVAGIFGLAFALFYADQMIHLLQARWPVGQSLAFLHLHAEPVSFVIGYVASLAVSFLTIVWATRVLGKLAPRALLAGETTAAAAGSGKRKCSTRILLGGLLGAAGCAAVGALSGGYEGKALGFFGCGALLLTASLAGLALWFRASGKVSNPRPSLTRLGVGNAGRYAVRSLLTVGLLASATFLITAVESFHKEVGADFDRRDGGSGGFALMAESDVPVFQDLNDAKVRAELNLPTKLFEKVTIYSFRLSRGDDASCLNLYQPLKPRMLGVPDKFVDERGGFHFSGGMWKNTEEKNDPWLLLYMSLGLRGTPVFADANTAQWILKVGLGGLVTTPDGNALQVVGLLKDSIFQSELLVAESSFMQLFPRHEGFNFFLIDCADQDPEAIKSSLEKALADHGIQVTRTADRLQAYLAVENMYLGTFQALGQLGLLLGAVGLALVLLRGVWERRSELALLQALGFRKSALAWLVLAENGFLLAMGLGFGTSAAFIAVIPHLLESGGRMIWQRLALMLGSVVLVGLAAGLAAVFASLRTPILTALRRE